MLGNSRIEPTAEEIQAMEAARQQSMPKDVRDLTLEGGMHELDDMIANNDDLERPEILTPAEAAEYETIDASFMDSGKLTPKHKTRFEAIRAEATRNYKR
ncbi:MAG: hypothetical protein L3K11_02655 [Thermoplasmata archaeon]|nr:hypothetical protein [Thermoplasmata archaeon]